jgi:hypothetical protein
MKRIFRRDGKATDRHEIASRVDIPLLSKPLKSVIEESLRKCGKERYRKGTILTPTFVVLAVLGLAIRRDLSYPAVLNWLVCGLRWLTCRWPHRVVAEGTLSHARIRLGREVFRRIFQKWWHITRSSQRIFMGLPALPLMEPAPPWRIRKRTNSASAFPTADVAREGIRNCAQSRDAFYRCAWSPILPTMPTQGKVPGKDA